jgi:hypothetical protein
MFLLLISNLYSLAHGFHGARLISILPSVTSTIQSCGSAMTVLLLNRDVVTLPKIVSPPRSLSAKMLSTGKNHVLEFFRTSSDLSIPFGIFHLYCHFFPVMDSTCFQHSFKVAQTSCTKILTRVEYLRVKGRMHPHLQTHELLH